MQNNQNQATTYPVEALHSQVNRFWNIKYNTMNTIKCITLNIVMLSISLCLSVASLANAKDLFVDAEVEQRVQSMSSSIDLRYTAEVKKKIKQYTISQRSASEVLLGRISIYFPLIESKLRERGMPDDLKYLAVIESGLRPHAKSRVGAAGLWQFMKPTARMYGMKITRTVDERRDPEISTDAALDYLQYLYDKYGDWALAMGAYNCGPGNMNKAIRKSNSKDFYKVSKYLPRETRGYVPKFIAMSYLMNYYYSHDLTPNMPDNNVLNTATSRVLKKINFKDLSAKYQLDLETIQLLNPTYIRNFIPSGPEHKLTLPSEKMADFLFGIESPEPLILYSHVNGKKRMLSAIRDAIYVDIIPSLDMYSSGDHAIPTPTKRFSATTNNAEAYLLSDKKYMYHTLRRKESLLDVANKHDMELTKLMEINSYTSHNLPDVGDSIKIITEG